MKINATGPKIDGGSGMVIDKGIVHPSGQHFDMANARKRNNSETGLKASAIYGARRIERLSATRSDRHLCLAFRPPDAVEPSLHLLGP